MLSQTVKIVLGTTAVLTVTCYVGRYIKNRFFGKKCESCCCEEKDE